MPVSREVVAVKTFKDGSVKYHTDACPRCGGSGRVPYLTDSGRCWKCGGSGYFPNEWIVPSDERLAKRAAKEKLKLMAQADEHNDQFLKSHGFKDGKTYIVLGNTYDIKDELKSIGAKYDYLFGWHLPEDNAKYETIEIDMHDVLQLDENDWLIYKDADEISDLIEKKKKEYKDAHRNPDDAISEYVGNIGDKITIDVIIERISSFETHYSYYGETTWIYRFKDEDGNIYIWKTGTGLDKQVGNRLVPMDEGEELTLTGTVKDHKEYKGEKETVLTRCKVK